MRWFKDDILRQTGFRGGPVYLCLSPSANTLHCNCPLVGVIVALSSHFTGVTGFVLSLYNFPLFSHTHFLLAILGGGVT